MVSPDSRTTIAYIIHSMNAGGAERSIARLINGMDLESFQPLVVCMSRSGPAASWIKPSGVPIVELHRRRAFDWGAIRRFVNILEEHAVDIVHSYNWGTLMESALAVRSARTRGHVHAERGSVLGCTEMRGIKVRIRGLLANWAMKRCNAIVTNGESVAKRVEERCGISASLVTVIPNGVESQRCSASELPVRRSDLKIPSDAIVVGSIGRLAKVKGFEVAIKAMCHFTNSQPECHLVLVGNGPLMEEHKELAASLGVAGRVHFVGHQTCVTTWYAMMDIYINTSYSEGMSQSLVEAMSAGCPIIATNVGEAETLLGCDQQWGKLINAGCSEELTDAIREFWPRDAREVFSERSEQRYLSSYTTEKMVAAYERLYHKISAGNGAE